MSMGPFFLIMSAPAAGMHAYRGRRKKGVDGWDKPGPDNSVFQTQEFIVSARER